ncbi:hypothetical protein HMPREF1531_00963 [Propionibacterium sp. oral taxon 192 str. F0372]|nr:hypothetical protein HMPREF1531_00963 [Propionibacterium sp. oral taxon 192 str. F0372]
MAARLDFSDLTWGDLRRFVSLASDVDDNDPVEFFDDEDDDVLAGMVLDLEPTVLD